MKKNHKQILKDYEVILEEIQSDEIILSEPMTLAQLREILMQISTILEERIEENIYVISAKSGKAISNGAILVVELVGEKLYISGYAKEGLINQKTFEKIIAKLSSKLSTGSNKKTVKKKFVTIGILILVITCILFGINVSLTMASIENYNKAAKKFNTYVDGYNEIASKNTHRKER